MEDETDRLIMLSIMEAFTRKINNLWLVPAKGRPYYEDLRRVFFKDESPEGLYPGCIVPEGLLGEIVVIIPIDKFRQLLEAWKKANPKMVKRFDAITQSQRREKAIRNIRHLF